MTATVPGKRERLVQAALNLAHQNGFHRTSLAMIAERSSVPLGNVYYYFKTKEDLGLAIIEALNDSLCATLAECETHRSHREQLIALVRRLVSMREGLSRYGCPFSSLAMELNKEESEFARKSSLPLETLLAWCERRFELMGKSATDSRTLALHLVSTIQGACLMSHAFHDDRVFEREGKTVINWLKQV